MTGVWKSAGIIATPLVLAAASCGPGVAHFSRDLGQDYTYVSTGTLQKYILVEGRYAVPNLVVDFAYDRDFILALRLETREHECGDPDLGAVDIFSGELEYWLIDKNLRRIHGPLAKRAFVALREQLGVSPDLRPDARRVPHYLALAESLGMTTRNDLTDCRPLRSE